MGDSSKKPKPRTGLATLNDIRQNEDSGEEGQAFYAGGSERSGQQVLGPPRENTGRDFISEFFRSAQQSSAASESMGAAGRSSGFQGSGYRLGQTENDGEMVVPSSSNTAPEEQLVVLKIWRQGFSIDDGEIRSFDDPENRSFFESILKGQIPPELRKQGMTTIHLDVEDHRHEEFKKPPKRFSAFAGEGHTLGSPVPGIESTEVVPPEEQKAKEQEAQQSLQINDSEPVTTLQIRLSDGSRITGRFNHSHTIADVRSFIVASRPNYASQQFSLLSSFPPKELAQEDLKLNEAGLLNATIVQRLK